MFYNLSKILYSDPYCSRHKSPQKSYACDLTLPAILSNRRLKAFYQIQTFLSDLNLFVRSRSFCQIQIFLSDLNLFVRSIDLSLIHNNNMYHLFCKVILYHLGMLYCQSALHTFDFPYDFDLIYMVSILDIYCEISAHKRIDYTLTAAP